MREPLVSFNNKMVHESVHRGTVVHGNRSRALPGGGFLRRLRGAQDGGAIRRADGLIEEIHGRRDQDDAVHLSAGHKAAPEGDVLFDARSEADERVPAALLHFVIYAADHLRGESALHETSEHADEAGARALESAAEQAGPVVVDADDVLDAGPDFGRDTGLILNDAAYGALGASGELGDFDEVEGLLVRSIFVCGHMGRLLPHTG